MLVANPERDFRASLDALVERRAVGLEVPVERTPR
jgi:hypothetical protein